MFSIKGMVAHLFMRLCGVIPLENKAVFISFGGARYGDNPKALYEEMSGRYPELKYVWIMKDPKTKIKGAKVVKANTFRAIYHFATAKLWISDTRLRIWMIKRKKQYYVQTWHGDIPLKKIENDAKDYLSNSYIEAAKHDSKMADLMLSGCKYRTSRCRDLFWYDGEILEMGTPKEVVYYMEKNKIRYRVLKEFNLDKDIQIALYCPTFRNDHRLNVYDLDYEMLLNALKNNWGGRWVILFRLHPGMSYLQNKISYTNTIINASSYPSTEELIMSSDLIITDYSSCMFHGLEAKKRVMLYVSDLEDYLAKERDLYFDLQELPFPFAKSNEELVRKIEDFNELDYTKKSSILRNKIGYVTNVDSCKNIVENIYLKAFRR